MKQQKFPLGLSLKRVYANKIKRISQSAMYSIPFYRNNIVYIVCTSVIASHFPLRYVNVYYNLSKHKIALDIFLN